MVQFLSIIFFFDFFNFCWVFQKFPIICVTLYNNDDDDDNDNNNNNNNKVMLDCTLLYYWIPLQHTSLSAFITASPKLMTSLFEYRTMGWVDCERLKVDNTDYNTNVRWVPKEHSSFCGNLRHHQIPCRQLASDSHKTHTNPLLLVAKLHQPNAERRIHIEKARIGVEPGKWDGEKNEIICLKKNTSRCISTAGLWPWVRNAVVVLRGL